MTILFDLATHNSIYSGVSKYAINILKGFQETGKKNIKILVSPLIYEQIHGMFPEYECIISKYEKGGGIQNMIRLSRQVDSIDCDILFATVPGKFFLLCNKPIVQTIHDLQFFLVNSIGGWMMRFLMPFIIFKSKKIISISDFVKGEILKYYPFMSPGKVKTIYNSVDIKIPAQHIPKRNYILYVSRIEKTKNVLTLLKAFNLIKDSVSVNLKLIGRKTQYWSQVLEPYIVNNGLNHRIELISNPLTEDELIRMYQECKLFVHPSLAEGFGYTPIEAAVLGTPVITTKETAIYETTLGLLNYCENPQSEEELASLIFSILSSPPDILKLERISKKLRKMYDKRDLASRVYDFIKYNG